MVYRENETESIDSLKAKIAFLEKENRDLRLVQRKPFKLALFVSLMTFILAACCSVWTWVHVHYTEVGVFWGNSIVLASLLFMVVSGSFGAAWGSTKKLFD